MKKKQILLIIISSIIFSINLYSKFQDGKFDQGESFDIPISTPHAAQSYAPILIIGNEALANFSDNNGDGTLENPYIIDGLVIDANGNGSVIEIRDTNRNFIIRNCVIRNSGKPIENYDYSYRYPNGDISYLVKAGIKLIDCMNVNITNNKIMFNAHGIYINKFSTNINIYNNTISYNNFGVFFFETSLNTISNNSISYNNYNIYLQESMFNTISNNTITNCAYIENNYGYDYYFYYPGAITLHWSEYNDIFNNDIFDNYGNGICLDGSSNNNIYANSICNNWREGIYFSYSRMNNLTSNNVSYNRRNGFFLEYSNYNNLTTNIALYNNVSGIHCASSHYNTLFGNNLSYNKYFGLSLMDSYGYAPSMMGSMFFFPRWASSSNNNIIYNNYIHFNSEGAIYNGGKDNFISNNVIVPGEESFMILLIVITISSFLITIYFGILSFKKKREKIDEFKRLEVVKKGEIFNKKKKAHPAVWLFFSIFIFLINATFNPFHQTSRRPESDQSNMYSQLIVNLIIIASSLSFYFLSKDHEKKNDDLTPFCYLFFYFQLYFYTINALIHFFGWNDTIYSYGTISNIVVICNIIVICLMFVTIKKHNNTSIRDYVIMIIGLFYCGINFMAPFISPFVLFYFLLFLFIPFVYILFPPFCCFCLPCLLAMFGLKRSDFEIDRSNVLVPKSNIKNLNTQIRERNTKEELKKLSFSFKQYKYLEISKIASVFNVTVDSFIKDFEKYHNSFKNFNIRGDYIFTSSIQEIDEFLKWLKMRVALSKEKVRTNLVKKQEDNKKFRDNIRNTFKF